MWIQRYFFSIEPLIEMQFHQILKNINLLKKWLLQSSEITKKFIKEFQRIWENKFSLASEFQLYKQSSFGLSKNHQQEMIHMKKIQLTLKTNKRQSFWQKKTSKTYVLECHFSSFNSLPESIMSSARLDIDPNYQAGIATLSQLIATFIASVIIDKLGWRNIWCISSALNEKFKWSNVLPLIMIFMYQLGFGLGFGPIAWFLVPEYFNDDSCSIATN